MDRKEYQKQYFQKKSKKILIQRRKYRQKIREILHKLKINGCAICRYNRCDRSLDFHHSNPKDKSFNINIYEFDYHSNEIITNEINKCILLCSNCHGEIHEKE